MTMKRYIRTAIIEPDVNTVVDEILHSSNPEYLRKWADRPEFAIKVALAINIHTPQDILSDLLQAAQTSDNMSEDMIIVANILNNPNTPLSAMDTLPLNILYDIAFTERDTVTRVKKYAITRLLHSNNEDMINMTRRRMERDGLY